MVVVRPDIKVPDDNNDNDDDDDDNDDDDDDDNDDVDDLLQGDLPRELVGFSFLPTN